MPTLSQREYIQIVRRQDKIEEELNFLKKFMRTEVEERRIKPSVMRRWERISTDLDRGCGRVFQSVADMRSWLKKLHTK